MSDLFSTLCLFLFITGLIYILIYYIFRVSELLSHYKFGKKSIIYWCIIFIIGSVFFTVKYFKPAYTRIGCFPLLTENQEVSTTVSDRLNFLLKRANYSDKSKIIYDLENTFEIISIDSALHKSFLQKFGGNIGLDYLILIHTRTTSDNYCLVNISLVDYKKNSTNLFNDTLYFHNPQHFFNKFNNQFKFLLNCNYSLTPDELFQKKDSWTKFGKGLLYKLKEHYLEAEKIFYSQFLVMPDNIWVAKKYSSVLLRKALQFKKDNKFRKDIFDKVFTLLNKIDYSENDSEIFKLLGKLYIQNENWNFAAIKLKKALEIHPNDPEVYYYLSKLHTSRLKDIGYTTKIKILKKSIFLNPAYLISSLKLGEIYLKRRELDNASEIFNNILFINSKSIDAMHGLGKLYLIQNNPVDFISIYRQILEIEPDNSNAFYNLGIAYLNSKEVERAEKFFQRSIDIDNNINSYFYLGVIHALKNNRSKAISYFSKRIEFGNNDEYAQEARKAIHKLQKGEVIIHLRSFHGFNR